MIIENFIGLGVLVIVLVMVSIIRDLIKKHLESIDFKFKQYAEAVNTLRTELEALRIEHNKLPCAIKK